MTSHTYKVIEIVGSSEISSDDAIRSAISAASATLNHIDWFEMVKQSGHIESGVVRHFQVTLKVGFRLDA